MNFQLISEAIVKFVNGTFPRSAELELADAYGDEAAHDVRAVFDKAMDCPVDWSSPEMNMNIALGILADFMAVELPQLSPEAKERLNYCYIMCWK
ncbi:MAG: hypothetical protein ACKVQJ_09425 [Pyrinomonadaceae bacterium]